MACKKKDSALHKKANIKTSLKSIYHNGMFFIRHVTSWRLKKNSCSTKFAHTITLIKKFRIKIIYYIRHLVLIKNWNITKTKLIMMHEKIKNQKKKDNLMFKSDSG